VKKRNLRWLNSRTDRILKIVFFARFGSVCGEGSSVHSEDAKRTAYSLDQDLTSEEYSYLVSTEKSSDKFPRCSFRAGARFWVTEVDELKLEGRGVVASEII
jgi:hypothetical protein